MADGKKKQASLAGTLREEVESRQGPEDGTVVRFQYCYDLTAKKKERTYYMYVAVFVADKDRWFISGQGSSISREQSHRELMELLAKPSTITADVATGFDTFKP